MRRRVTVWVALLTGLLAASPAAAQERCFAGHANLEGQFGIELGGGLAVPLGQLGDVAVLDTHPGDTGLDTHRGWNGLAGADYYMTSFMSAGVWVGQNTLDMRDQILPTSTGTGTFTRLLRGTTSMLGLRVKAFLPMPGTWSPYAAAGVTHFHRKAQLSGDMASLDPGASVFDMTDDAMGFDLGAGFEYRMLPAVGLGVGTTYYYSGAFGHDLRWMGRDRIVSNWEFWTVDARLTIHVPGMKTR